MSTLTPVNLPSCPACLSIRTEVVILDSRPVTSIDGGVFINRCYTHCLTCGWIWDRRESEGVHWTWQNGKYEGRNEGRRATWWERFLEWIR